MSTSIDDPAPPPPARSFFERLASARFFTASVLVHIVLLILIGGTVILQSTEAPDFEAGSGEILAESSEPTGPPEDTSVAAGAMTNTAAAAPAPTMDLVTANAMKSAYTMNTTTSAVRSNNIADSMAANLGKKAGQAMGSGIGSMGRAGGTKMGMIFGKKVEATKLGVILDVSGSAHPKLAGAIQEIEKTFSDSIIVLYPGCGMLDDKKGRHLHQVKKFSAIPKKDLEGNIPGMTTPGQLVKALKIAEFEQLTTRPNMKERLFVSWYDKEDRNQLITHADAAFEDLIARGVDSIYWFADFRDTVSPEAVEDLLKDLKRKKIKVYLHNFAGPVIPPQTLVLAEKTGGTSNAGEPKK